MKKPYKAKSLTGARRRVRVLEKLMESQRDLLDQYADDRKTLAKLAAEGPTFFNPLHVMAAKGLRNSILANMGLNPDGTFKK